MTDHTPEPCICGPLPEPYDDNCPQHGERRIQACLDACAGIPTEQIEVADFKTLIKAADTASEVIYEGFESVEQDLDAALDPFRKN